MLSEPMIECTGLFAQWCPIHGDCKCKDPEESLDDEDCPLHSWLSTHGDPTVFHTVWGDWVPEDE